MPRPDVAQLLSDLVTRAPSPPPFVADRAVRVRWAPGRLDVLGGLGAEAGGTVAQMALPARVAAAVQFSDARVLTIHHASPAQGGAGGESVIQVALDDPVVPGNSWAGPIAALWRLLPAFLASPPAGAAIRIHSAIPSGAGQASSTALLTALLLAITDLAAVPQEAADLAMVIQRAEALAAGRPESPGNAPILDALTCLLAEAGTMLRFSAQPHRLVGAVPIPPDLRVLALDTGVRSATTGETLDELRIAGAMGLRIIDTIYRDLGQSHTPLHGYLANTSPLLYRQYFRTLLPKRLRGQDFMRTYGTLSESADAPDPAKFYRVRTAVDHLIAENEHAEQFLQAMEELADMPGWGDREEEAERQRTLQRAGRLALASHHSYRLRLELSCREADWLVDRLMESGPERGIYGARITGCGGGGTVMALVDRGQTATDAILEVIKTYAQVTGFSLGVSEAGTGGSLETDKRRE